MSTGVINKKVIKPFLILQLRPEDKVADDELAAMMRYGDLNSSVIHRVRIDKEPVPNVNLEDYSGVIMGGSPYNASDKNKSQVQHRFEIDLFKMFDTIVSKDVPYLGACYGLGILNYYLGGVVSKERYSESIGAVTVEVNDKAKADPLLEGLPKAFRAFVGHKEACQMLPQAVTPLARSQTCAVQMVRVKKNIYATQFHPELDSAGLALRINTYKYAGYFPPDSADNLIAEVMEESVIVPSKILNRFVKLYSSPASV